ncbi:MAG: hypothetical protein FWC79_02375 [Oscillospiraceae bacterium]|nr:hypothetical protein [Oscillospiraceae bacterium]
MLKFKNNSKKYTAEDFFQRLFENLKPEEFLKATLQFWEERDFSHRLVDVRYPLHLTGQLSEAKVLDGKKQKKGVCFEIFLDFHEEDEWNYEAILERATKILEAAGFDVGRGKDLSRESYKMMDFSVKLAA